jgi:hypothetical protein
MEKRGQKNSVERRWRSLSAGCGKKKGTMNNETPESAMPKDFFTKLFEPTGKQELEKPITPPGSRISKALASELNVKADKPEVAND